MTRPGTELEALLRTGCASHRDVEDYLTTQVDFERILGSGHLQNTERDFQLQAFRQMLRDLGSPHQSYPVIHVAGTKGKGSTCAMIAAILEAHGLRVGQYSSPHLERYTERIRVQGQEISPGALGALLMRVRDHQSAAGEEGGRPDGWRTLFEQLTAAAFLHFETERVDVAVVETGLGGRLDATNVHHQPGPYPVVSVITAIGLDHTAILGNTPYAIACEKAGIVHGHCGLVVGIQPPLWAAEVEQALEDRVRKLALPSVPARAVRWAASDIQVSDVRPSHWRELARFVIPGGEDLGGVLDLTIGLPGRHQVDNARTAIQAVRMLRQMLSRHSQQAGMSQGSWCLDAKAIQIGLAGVRWPARLEVLDTSRPVILDGAHCPLSVRATMETLARHGAEALGAVPRGWTVVMGLMQDKDASAILQAMADGGAVFTTRDRIQQEGSEPGVLIQKIIATQARWPRALSAVQLREQLQAHLGHGPSVESVECPEEAFRRALDGDTSGVLGVGSLYLPGPFRRSWETWKAAQLSPD